MEKAAVVVNVIAGRTLKGEVAANWVDGLERHLQQFDVVIPDVVVSLNRFPRGHES